MSFVPLSVGRNEGRVRYVYDKPGDRLLLELSEHHRINKLRRINSRHGFESHLTARITPLFTKVAYKYYFDAA
jgi:hypothetical protein